jgi:hypothetical protein
MITNITFYITQDDEGSDWAAEEQPVISEDGNHQRKSSRRPSSLHYHKKRHSIDATTAAGGGGVSSAFDAGNLANSYHLYKYEKNMILFNSTLADRKAALLQQQQNNSRLGMRGRDAAINIDQHCIYQFLLAMTEQDAVIVGEVLVKRMPIYTDMQANISNGFSAVNEELLRQQEEFAVKIESTAAAMEELVRADLERLDQLQTGLSMEIDAGLQHLAGLCASITSELNPRLADQRSATHSLLADAYQLQNRFTELGYVILAFLLRTTASIFWIFTMMARVIGVQRSPERGQQRGRQSVDTLATTQAGNNNKLNGSTHAPGAIDDVNYEKHPADQNNDVTSPIKQRFDDLRRRMAATSGH